MKRAMIVCVLAVFAAVGMNAQQGTKGVSADYPQFGITAFSPSAAADKQAAPFLAGRCVSGKKEQFGILLARAPGTMPVVEFIGSGAKVLRTMTVNELLGIDRESGVRLLPSMSSESETQADVSYEVAFPQGKNTVTVRTISTGESDGAKARIIVSFLLKTAVKGLDAVRLSLPVEGGVSVLENGFMLSAKSQAAAFSAAVFPKPQSITAVKDIVTLQSAVKPGTGYQADRPLLWMVVEGSSSSSVSGAKADAAASLASNVKNSAKPHLIIVTTANTQSTQPADTVAYTIVCVNVGLGSASDVVVKNPIPDGTRYIEGSASGQGTEIRVERDAKPAPQQGAASAVHWKLNEPLQPGAEKVVSFKVIVR